MKLVRDLREYYAINNIMPQPVLCRTHAPNIKNEMILA